MAERKETDPGSSATVSARGHGLGRNIEAYINRAKRAGYRTRALIWDCVAIELQLDGLSQQEIENVLRETS